MLVLGLFARLLGGGSTGTGCAVQGGPGCALWGDGTLWGDGSTWCSDLASSFEFVAEQEAHAHRLAAVINFTYCYTPGKPEAFGIHEIRARIAPDRQADFPYMAFIDAISPSERLSCVVNYTSEVGVSDEFEVDHIYGIIQAKKHQPKG